MKTALTTSSAWLDVQPLVLRLAASLSVERVTDTILQELPRLLQARALLVAVPDAGSGWRCAASVGDLATVPQEEALPLVAQAAQERAPVRGALAGREAVAVPLLVRNRPRGVLVADAIGALDDLVGVLSLQCAIALDRALLHDEELARVEELEASEARFRSLVHELEAVFWECDPKTFQFSFISKRAEAMLGYPTQKWLQPGFWASIVHPEDRHWAVGFCVECTEEGRDHAFEYRLLAADGSVRWFRDVVYVLRDAEGRATKLRGVMVDITDERKDDRRVARRIQAPRPPA